ncbi:MAG: heat-inducible transcriptional repressor HrcA [Clostridiales bacterium]|jgi:heat-inducible transcriptional repressor|nr:heat-inducible transcriptional repressor HrcA [Clostridiales bacterium]
MIWDDRLDERKIRILKAIIDDYIINVEPVGSRTIAKKHELGLSSATIRNEMSDLEEMGYLAQPYTSAGRIPSDKGYRLYVDHLVDRMEPTAEDILNIRETLEQRIDEMGQLIKIASELLSKITNYTSIAVAPALRKLEIKALQVVPIETGRALVIVVMEGGAVKNTLINIDQAITADNLIIMSNIINTKLAGCPAEDISIIKVNEIVETLGINRDKILPIIDGVIDCIRQIESSEIYTQGKNNILKHPEFNDIDKARTLLTLFEKNDVLLDIMNKSLDPDVDVRIGSENEIKEMKDCTIITVKYSIGDTSIGNIGLIGPTRMNYSKVISSLEYIRKKINSEIVKLIGHDDS